MKNFTHLKKMLVCFIALFASTASFAQVVVIDPNGDGGFETGATFQANGWTVVNPATGTDRIWYVGTGMSGYSGAAAAFIGSNATTVSTVNTSRTIHFYRSITIPAGAENIQLTYKYKQPVADPVGTTPFDYLTVRLSATAPVSGTLPTGTILSAAFPLVSIPDFTQQTATLPNSVAGTTTNLIFTFKGDTVSPNGAGGVDDISLTYTMPACAAPAGLQVTAQAQTATLSWTAPSNAPSDGYQYAVTTADVAPTTFLTATGTTGNVGSLAANTPHFAWVRSVCGSATSSWVKTSFSTTCLPYDAPFEEQFSGGVLPSCWTNTSSNPVANGLWKFAGPAEYAIGNTRPNGTFAWADGSSPSNINDVTLTTPLINLATLTSPQLVFEFYSNNTGTYANNVLKVDVYNGTTWVNVFSNNTSLAEWRTSELSLSAFAGTTVKIRFVFDKSIATLDNAFYNDILVDNVKVVEAPTCFRPTNLQAVATGPDSINISWNAPTPAPASGYEYYVSTDALDAPVPNSQTVGVPTGTSAVYAAMESTAYFIWVRSKCAGTDRSEWTGPVAVTTPCSATDIPYLQDFEAVTPPALPECTTAVKTGLGNTWVTNATTTGGFTSNTLRYNFTYSGPANTWFFTQGINLTAGTSYRISYKYGASSATYTEKMKVAYGTSNTAAGMTTQLADYPSISGTTYNTVGIDFVPATSGVYYFGFQAYSALGQNYLYVDDISVDLSPTCLSPVNVQAQAVNQSSIAISWGAPSTAPSNGYEYYVSTDALDAPMPNTQGVDVPTGTSATYAAMENTAYFIWVRSKCAGADRSEWSGPVAVTTPCSATDVPYLEDFEAVAPPALPECTTAVKTGLGNIWTTFAATTGGFSSNTLRYAFTYSGDANTWFFTKGVNLTAGTSYRITYKYGASSTFYTEKLKVAYGTTNTAAGMTTQLANYPSISGTAYNTASIDFVPAASGVYYFGFQAYSVLGQNYLYVDDIAVNVSPTCLSPVNVQAQATSPSSVAISWTAPSTLPSNGYEYYVGTDVTDVPTANTQGVNVPTGTTATYAAQENTKYYIYVRSRCTSENSEWTQMVSVTTPCTATNVPYVQDFESVTTPALPDCTTTQNAGTGNNWTTNNPAAYGFTTNALRYSYSTTNAANAWYFTQGINLTAGVTYRILYKYGNSGNTTYIEKLKVAYGTTANASAMNTVLADYNNINSNIPVQTHVDFTPQSSGVYYFGFNAYSVANQDRLYVDDIMIDATAGTGSHALGQFTYYPNPVKDVLNLSYSTEITSVEVFNMLGQKVLAKIVNAAEATIDMTQLPDGNYVVNVATADAIKTVKVVKKQ